MYVEKLRANIEDNHLANFWIDTTNDKVLETIPWNKSTQMFKSDVKRLAGKHLVNVNLVLRPRLDFDGLKADATLFYDVDRGV